MKKILVTILLFVPLIAHADFQSKVMEITTPATTGNQTISGVGFQPKAMVCLSAMNIVEGTTTSAAIGITFAASTSPVTNGTQFSFFATDDSITYRKVYASSTMQVIDSSGNSLASSSLVQFNSDGAVFNWNVANGTRYLHSCTFYGGSDITNAKIVGFVTPSSNGVTMSNTDVGFQADVHKKQSIALSNQKPPPSINTNYNWSFGAAARAATTTQVGFSGGENSPGFGRVQKNNFIEISGDAAVYTEFVSGYLKTFDATGFTAYFATSTNIYTIALAIQGGSWNTGVFNQNVSSGNQSVSGLGSYTPTSLILGSINNPSTTAVLTDKTRNSMGMCTSPGQQAYVFEGQTGQSSYNGNYGTSSALRLLTNTSNGAASTQSIINCSSFNSGGFTFNNSGSDGNSVEVLYIAAGPSPVVATAPTITTSAPASVSDSSMVLNGLIVSDGNASTTVRGFAYGTDPTLATVIATTTENGTFGISSFSTTTPNLTSSTDYYFRAYSTNSAGTGYGSILSTTTPIAAIIETPTPTPAPTQAPSSGGGTVQNRVSNLISLGFNEQAQKVADQYGIPMVQMAPVPATALSFTRTLRQGMTGQDIKRLQIFLNSQGFTVSKTGAGSLNKETTYFGPATKAALMKFQEAHRKEVLDPLGLLAPTGFFGLNTIKAANILLGK
jgi:hypothetical protein